MVRKLIAWAVHNPLVALLVAVALATFGAYAFLNINVEAYPDPAPAILEVVAQYRLPGKVRHPQRGTFAQNGMRGLNDPRSTDNARLTDVKCRFTSGTPARSSRFVSPSQSSGRCHRIARG